MACKYNRGTAWKADSGNGIFVNISLCVQQKSRPPELPAGGGEFCHQIERNPLPTISLLFVIAVNAVGSVR